MCIRVPGSCSQNWYLKLFGTARLKKQRHRTTESFIYEIEIYAFGQPQKYLCFSSSSLEGGRKQHVEVLVSPSSKTWCIRQGVSVYWNKTQQTVVFHGSWRCLVWLLSGVKRNSVIGVLRSYDVCVCVCVWSKTMFLTLPCQGTTPHTLKMNFPGHTSGRKQKHK
jgi:hypothetical protein